jgi:hypothetical protein
LLSITQGPAITASGKPPPICSAPTAIFLGIIKSGADDFHSGDCGHCPAVLQGSLNETPEKRMAGHGSRFKFWMKLATQEPGVFFELDDFH